MSRAKIIQTPTNQDEFNCALKRKLVHKGWLKSEDDRHNVSDIIKTHLKHNSCDPDAVFELEKDIFIFEVDERIKSVNKSGKNVGKRNYSGAAPHTFKAHAYTAGILQSKIEKCLHLIEVVSHPKGNEYMRQTDEEFLPILEKKFKHKYVVKSLLKKDEIIMELIEYIEGIIK